MAGLRLGIDPTGMETGGRRAESALERVKREARETSGAVENSSTRMGNATTGLAAKAGRALGVLGVAFLSVQSAANSVNLARGFNASLAEASTLIDGTTAQMDGMSASARELAREFGGSATSQVQGFYQAISAGAESVEDATLLLESANKLAIGGVTATTTAVDALTTATNAYAAQGLTAAQASDALFVGIKAGKTTAAELSAGLGNIVPIASAVGVSFDEVVAATAALTTQGQSTAVAITGLRQVISGVLKPTSEATKLADKLGLSFDAQALKSQGLAGFLEQVIQKTGGSQEAMAQLFGSVEALNAVLAFAGGAGEKFAQINEDMANKAGATDEAYKKMADSLDQRWSRATAAMTDIALGLGSVLLTVVVPALEAVAALSTAVSGAVQTLAGYFASLSQAANGASSAMLAQSALETAIDNTTIAIGDQRNASIFLHDALANGNVMSIETIRIELEKARARREDVLAMAAQRQELALQGPAYQAILADMQTARDALRSTSINDAEQYENAEQYLVSAINRQKEFLSDIQAGTALRGEESDLLSQIEANIAELEARQNALTGATSENVILTERLADVAASVSFEGAIDNAYTLSRQLGVALSVAQAIAQASSSASISALNAATAGGPDAAVASSRSGEAGRALTAPAGLIDQYGGTSGAFRSLRVPDVRGGGRRSGRSGGAGAASSANDTADAYDRLLSSLDPVVRATQQYEEAQQTINTALETGHATAAEAAGAFDLATERFEKATAAASGNVDIWSEMERSGGAAIDRLIDGTGNLEDSLKDVIKQLVIAITKKNLLAKIDGGSSSDSLGSLIFKGFAGLFDNGGTIGNGQTGIVGEYGPELVKSTPTGAVVTSREDTSRRLDGNRQSGGVMINVDARGAQEGVAQQIVAALQVAGPQIAGQAYDQVKTNWGALNQQFSTDGAL